MGCNQSTSHTTPELLPPIKPSPQITPKPIHDKKPTIQSSSLTPFEKKILDYHNKARRENNYPELVWDKQLKQRALDWTKHLQSKGNNQCNEMFRHPGTDEGTMEEKVKYLQYNAAKGRSDGQNISKKYGVKVEGDKTTGMPDSPENAVTGWYDECKLYDSKNQDSQGFPRNSMQVGHYTQMMWKDAKKIGCAEVPCNGPDIKSGNTVYPQTGSVIYCNYDKGNLNMPGRNMYLENVPSKPRCSPPNNWIFS